MTNIDIDFPVLFAEKFSLNQDLYRIDDSTDTGLIQRYQKMSDNSKEHKISFDSFFSQSVFQSDHPQVPRWDKQHSPDRWHPVQGGPPDTGWHDSWQKPQSSHFCFGSGPTIDRGNTLRDRSFKELDVFGDSLSDTGNFSGLAQGAFPPSPPFATNGTIKGKPNGAGRLSNGNLWVEYFAEDLNIKKNKVHNSAFIGSTSGRENVAPQTAADLGIEFPSTLQLPGVLNQIDRATSGNPKALDVVWGGANDFITLLAKLAIDPSPSTLVNQVVQGVENVSEAVCTLAKKGAKTIVVPNLPNLGLTPFANGQNTKLQNFVPAATFFSLGFDLLLQPMLVNLERQLKDVDIVQVDIFSLSEDIAHNRIDIDGNGCPDPEYQDLFKNKNDSLFAAQAVNPGVNPNDYVFADNFHPTTAVHKVFADLFEESLSRPVASRVFETSEMVIRDLMGTMGTMGTSEGASFLSSLSDTFLSGGGDSIWKQVGVPLGCDTSPCAIFG